MPDPASTAVAEEPAPPRPPMDTAKRLVHLHREKKRLNEELGTVQAEITLLDKGEMLMAIDAENFPSSAKVDGASVFLWTQIWASPAKGEDDEADHARLTAVLDGLGLHHLMPSNVNTQSLSAYVREQIDNAPLFNDDGEALDLEARARLVLPASLVDALNLTMKREVHVNGA